MPLAVVGIVACCGVSTLSAAVVGVTLLGIETEVWVLAIVGVVVLSALKARAAVRRAR